MQEIEKQMQDSSESIQAISAPKNRRIQAVSLAQELLMAMREEGKDPKAAIEAIGAITPAQLASDLGDEAKKLAFWINVYNAFNLYWMRMVPANSAATKKTHFFGKRINVAGQMMSLNDIEHGILRHSQAWWGRGYVKKWFPNSFEKRFRVKKLDQRIHFALNCGANGCPPIRFYTSENIESEMNLATQGFMQTEVQSEGANIKVSRIFWMYKGDFGGRKGIAKWVGQFRPELKDRLKGFGYFPYDHTENLDNFVDF